MPNRKCAGDCQRVLARTVFSKRQWRKGEGQSRCPDCIDGKFCFWKLYSSRSYENPRPPQVEIHDKIFIKMPCCNDAKLALVVALTRRRVDVIFDTDARRRVRSFRRSSILEPKSKGSASDYSASETMSTGSKTPDLSLVSHTHGRSRRAERGITKKNIQHAIKYGQREATRPGADGRPR